MRRGWSWSGYERSVLFLNDGGARFRELGSVLGADQVSDGRGLAAGDLDGDGDLDLVGTCRTTPHVYVLRNDLRTERHFVLLDLVPREHRSAAGSRLVLTAGGRTQRRDVALGSGFVSQHALTQHFGLGEASVIERLELTWPDGEKQLLERVPVDRRIRVRQGSNEFEELALAPRNAHATYRLPEIEWDARAATTTLLGSGRPDLSDLLLEDLDGKTHALVAGASSEGQAGPALLLNLWATWCQNCRREMPALIRANRASKGLRVIGISLDDGPTELVRETASEWGLDFPIVHLTGAARETLLARIEPLLTSSGGLALPTSLLLGRDGQVLALSRGAVDVTGLELYLEERRALEKR